MRGGQIMAKPLLRTNKEVTESYEKYKLMIYRVCFTYMKNVTDTEDMVQDTFIQLIRKGPKFESDEHEKAWLLRVAINLCKNKLKHWWRKRSSIENEERLGGSTNIQIDTTLQVIMDLPDKYKTVIYLYYYEGYDSVEISNMLEKPASTVRNHLHEARNELRKKLGGEFE